MPELHHSYATCRDPIGCTHLTHVLSPILRKRRDDEKEIILFKAVDVIDTSEIQKTAPPDEGISSLVPR